MELAQASSPSSSCLVKGKVSKILKSKYPAKVEVEVMVDRAIKGTNCEIDRDGYPKSLEFSRKEAGDLKLHQLIYFEYGSFCNEEGCSSSSTLLSEKEALSR